MKYSCLGSSSQEQQVCQELQFWIWILASSSEKFCQAVLPRVHEPGGLSMMPYCLHVANWPGISFLEARDQLRAVAGCSESRFSRVRTRRNVVLRSQGPVIGVCCNTLEVLEGSTCPFLTFLQNFLWFGFDSRGIRRYHADFSRNFFNKHCFSWRSSSAG